VSLVKPAFTVGLQPPAMEVVPCVTFVLGAHSEGLNRFQEIWKYIMEQHDLRKGLLGHPKSVPGVGLWGDAILMESLLSWLDL
jgi:hypothetical protein